MLCTPKKGKTNFVLRFEENSYSSIIYNVVRYFIKAAHPCATQKVPARLQILIYRRPTWSVQLGLVGTLYVMYLQVPPGIKNILGFLDLTTKLYQ